VAGVQGADGTGVTVAGAGSAVSSRAIVESPTSGPSLSAGGFGTTIRTVDRRRPRPSRVRRTKPDAFAAGVSAGGAGRAAERASAGASIGDSAAATLGDSAAATLGDSAAATLGGSAAVAPDVAAGTMRPDCLGAARRSTGRRGGGAVAPDAGGSIERSAGPPSSAAARRASSTGRRSSEPVGGVRNGGSGTSGAGIADAGGTGSGAAPGGDASGSGAAPDAEATGSGAAPDTGDGGSATAPCKGIGCGPRSGDRARGGGFRDMRFGPDACCETPRAGSRATRRVCGAATGSTAGTESPS
jgi:hypothetical protein